MTNPAPTALRDLLDAGLSSLFDPQPIAFRAVDERGVSIVRKACASASAMPCHLRRPLNRNAFLCGCLDLTETEPREHLIAGFGRRFGSTTHVEAIAHAVGSAGQVVIPRQTWTAIHLWLEQTPRGEVLLVHNHPSNALNVLFDNLPLASEADRDTWLRAVLGGKRLRCYLVENGYMREFRTPSLLRFIERWATGARAGAGYPR